jgi:predicted N-acyltransferase
MIGERMGRSAAAHFCLARWPADCRSVSNLIGSDCLDGRYWGDDRRRSQPAFSRSVIIRRSRTAIAMGPEAGGGWRARGAISLARGYRPVPTWSAHFIPDPNFRQAVADYLEAERRAVAQHISELDEFTPFKKG